MPQVRIPVSRVSGKDLFRDHISFIYPYAKSVTAVDLNTIKIAKKRNKNFDNIKEDRQIALNYGVLTNPREVPATIVYKNKNSLH